jgi:hypothetical protein
LLVYPERTRATAEPVPPGTVPRAYGLAPAAIAGPGAVLVAAGPEEAIWLGFQTVDPSRPVTLRVRAAGDGPQSRLTCPPDYCLPGLRVPAGHLPFTAGELALLLEQPIRARATLQIVPPERFTEATGQQAAPLDPDSAYGGWRLP